MLFLFRLLRSIVGFWLLYLLNFLWGWWLLNNKTRFNFHRFNLSLVKAVICVGIPGVPSISCTNFVAVWSVLLQFCLRAVKQVLVKLRLEKLGLIDLHLISLLNTSNIETVTWVFLVVVLIGSYIIIFSQESFWVLEQLQVIVVEVRDDWRVEGHRCTVWRVAIIRLKVKNLVIGRYFCLFWLLVVLESW
jgi:hypothetical protein